MHKMKDLGLLTPDLLGVLPNNYVGLFKFYRPILNELVTAFQSQPLVPVITGSHAPGNKLFRGAKSIRDFIETKDLQFLSGDQTATWAMEPDGNRSAKEFLDCLNIREWSWLELYKAMQNDFANFRRPAAAAWMADKKDEWLRSFYILLGQALSLLGFYKNGEWCPSTEKEREAVQQWKIIRTQSNELVTSRNAFLPESGEIDPDYPRVKSSLVRTESGPIRGVFDFLCAIGVKRVEEREREQQRNEIIKELETFYRPGSEPVKWDFHIEQLHRFIKWWSKNKDDSVFRDFNFQILFGDEQRPLKPNQIYLDTPFKDTGLSALFAAELPGIPRRHSLCRDYAAAKIPNLVEFAKTFGAIDQLHLERPPIDENPNWEELCSGNWRRTSNEHGVDYTIKWLDALLRAKNVQISQLLWRTMSSQNSEVLRAKYRANNSYDYSYEDSQLVCRLRSAAWIPNLSGEFLKPSDANSESLPNGFDCDVPNGWLTAVGFGSKRNQDSVVVQQKREAANSVGLPSEVADLLGQLSQADKDAAIVRFLNELRRCKNEPNSPIEPKSLPKPPEREPRDPVQRRNKIEELIRNAPPVDREVRQRIVRKNWGIKKEARFELRELNTNEDDQLVCQICRHEMPFKRLDGEYYFEAVECVEGLSLELPQNFLALCPVCSAKFQHANETSADELKKQILNTNGSEISVTLARQQCSIQFTGRHIFDLRIALKIIET